MKRGNEKGMKNNYPKEIGHYDNIYIFSEKAAPILSERDFDKMLEYLRRSTERDKHITKIKYWDRRKK